MNKSEQIEEKDSASSKKKERIINVLIVSLSFIFALAGVLVFFYVLTLKKDKTSYEVLTPSRPEIEAFSHDEAVWMYGLVDKESIKNNSMDHLYNLLQYMTIYYKLDDGLITPDESKVVFVEEDPKSYCDQIGYYGGLWAVDLKDLTWFFENKLNVSEFTKEYFETLDFLSTNEKIFIYYDNGKVYFTGEESGWGLESFDIIEYEIREISKDLYSYKLAIHLGEDQCEFYVVVELREQDGQKFWSYYDWDYEPITKTDYR